MKEPVLRVERLTKFYSGFILRGATFSVYPGRIMGMIGRDGAGKTTALKCALGLERPTAGTVRFFGLDQAGHDVEIKQRTGFLAASMEFYPRKKIRDIAAAVSRFYDTWDEGAYQKYLTMLDINPQKSPAQLGEAGQIKLFMLLSLSHQAELLILDEPTTGKRPAVREELLELFKTLRSEGTAILFTTSDTSDLDRCADDITYLREGTVIASEELVDFINYRRIRGFGNNLDKIMLHYEKETSQ